MESRPFARSEFGQVLLKMMVNIVLMEIMCLKSCVCRTPTSPLGVTHVLFYFTPSVPLQGRTGGGCSVLPQWIHATTLHTAGKL